MYVCSMYEWVEDFTQAPATFNWDSAIIIGDL